MDNPAEPKQRNVKAYWHAYHDGESPLGFVDRDERIWEIDTIKSKTESPKQIAWRKHLLRKEPIEGLPEDLVAAGQQLNAARQQWDAAWQQLDAAGQQLNAAWQQLNAAGQQLNAAWQQLNAAWQQLNAAEQQLDAAGQQLSAAGQQLSAAGQQWDAAVERHLPLLVELHAKYCGCPWTPENSNIFNFMPEAF